MSFRKQVEWFLRNEQGAELAEYAVGIALLVAIAMVVYSTLGAAINDQNSGTADKVDDVSDKTFPW